MGTETFEVEAAAMNISKLNKPTLFVNHIGIFSIIKLIGLLFNAAARVTTSTLNIAHITNQPLKHGALVVS